MFYLFKHNKLGYMCYVLLFSDVSQSFGDYDLFNGCDCLKSNLIN
jgi:hypothetical protein